MVISIKSIEIINFIELILGKDTGVVTTTRITHATPASMYAHTAQRDWECWNELKKDEVETKTTDIAWQMINEKPGKDLKVMLGGGKSAFKPKQELKDGYDSDYVWDCHTAER